MAKLLSFLLLAAGFLGVAAGGYYGLLVAPPDSMMGEVYRILYVHVPSAWMALLAWTFNFIACVVYLFRASDTADAFAEATAEVGVVFGLMCLMSGSIWAKPTWGTYWTWDPRLTSMAIIWFAYAGYLALRRFVDDREKRATFSAAVGILAAVGVPIVYFSVKWWNSIHQAQSNPQSVDSPMAFVLRINGIAFLLLFIAFLMIRYRVALREQASSAIPPPARHGVPNGEGAA
jgi:heme exporter protein C